MLPHGVDLRDGEKAMLWLDPSRILIFDPRTGENLTRKPSAGRQADPSGDPAAVPPQRAG